MAKPKKKKGARKTRKALTPKQVHAKVSSLLRKEAAETSAVVTRAVAAAVKPVSFSCSNLGCLVGITSGSIHFVFSRTGGANFPVGVSNIFYSVQGPANQAFSISVQGGTFDAPINSQLTAQGKAGGMRKLTVTA